MSACRSSRQHRQRTTAVLAVAASVVVTFTFAAAGLSPAGAAERGPAAARTAAYGRSPAAARVAFTPPTRALTPIGDLGSAVPGGVALTGKQAAAATASAVPGPLHTSGRWIENAQGQRVKLASVNWDGTESPQAVVGGLDHKTIDQIAIWIKANGFNSVRIPWSNYMYEHDPIVSSLPACENPNTGYDCLAANTGLKNLDALSILDLVIQGLAKQGLMVILDNHTSDAQWCCGNDDDNGVWYNHNYPLPKWYADWTGMATRYQNDPNVIGAELRNEPRVRNAWPKNSSNPLDQMVKPNWGGTGDDSNDWWKAATKAGNAVLAVDPNWLIFVDGLSYSLDLTGVGGKPVQLTPPNRVVYSPHAYAFSGYGAPAWSGWYTKGINGQVTDTVGAVEYGQTLMLFARGTDGHAYEKQWTEPSGPWSAWYGIQGNITSAPAAVVYHNQVLLFARGTDGQVYEDVGTPSATNPPGSWSGWYGIQGYVTDGLTAAVFNDQVQVFGRGTDGQVYADVWTPSAPGSNQGSWTGWYVIGGQIVGAPAAVAFGQQLLLFARGTDNQVYEDYLQGGSWSGWYTAGIGGQVTSSPAAAVFGQYQVQIFARGTDGAVYADVFTTSAKNPPGSWSGWHSLGGSVTGAPGATAFGQNQMQVFGRGTDGQVYADVWTDRGYQGFAQDIGRQWGYILTQGQSYTAPLWVSEWGTCIQPASGKCGNSDTTFFDYITQYLAAGDIDFAYWQLGSELLPGRPPNNATCPLNGGGSITGCDYYALLDPLWDDWPASTPASANVQKVESLEAATQGP
ncbi:MAG: cellulase family glycosylhydrolase [Streptosporangiaceae bacterium]|nr:cellulase family glycosylhydrolase [Streptosporangiaceae bacterium]MBV9854416.1 cellulase family glycosylhydrolase [Streptosporangiaceae bacterium]